jgi:hypothetical protein
MIRFEGEFGVRLLIGAFLFLAGDWSETALPMRLVTNEGARKHLPATMPGGIAVFDFDGDGRLDLFFPNGASLPGGAKRPHESNKLFRNVGGMRFEDATARAGLAGNGYDFAAAAGDFDGDGRLDLLVAGLRRVTLYRNLGGGQFADVTAAAKLDNQGRWSVGAAWLDYDGDGRLDLFVVNYVAWDPASEPESKVEGVIDFCHPQHYAPVANALFRNNGDGTFADVSAIAGIAALKGKGMAVAVADFNGDRRPDLFVTNDRMFNFLLLNEGGKFREAAFDWGAAVPASGNPPSSMGVDAQDFDNDGRPDLVYTALRDETFPLYRNLGAEFEEITAKSGLGVLTRAMAGWGVVFADLDNDGRKDIAVARSDVLSRSGARGANAPEPLAWFRNAGAKFATGAIGVKPRMYRGIVAADLDGDGCLDLVATALNEAPVIVRNPCPAGNWLMVAGAPVGSTVQVAGQYRYCSTAVGYASSYAGPLHFGLGAARSADVTVTFANGESKTLRGVPSNQVVRP